MFQFSYKLTIAERVKTKCERHPRYNPERDGRGGIKGGCTTCFSLYDLHQARLTLDSAHRDFLRRAIRGHEPSSLAAGLLETEALTTRQHHSPEGLRGGPSPPSIARPRRPAGSLSMAYIEGEGRSQGTLFPVVLDDLVPADHMCRLVDAFVAQLDMNKLDFERAQAADTGRPGYDPRSLLKLYLYGYLNQIRSSRRLETECRRNVEVTWLLERLYPDYKSIAEFRRMHREAVTGAGVELVHFAKICGLIRGEWIAVDGSKFRAVASIDTARERFQLQRYLDNMEKLDREQTPEFDSAGVQAALERLKHHPEPEIGFMVMGRHTQPAYNLQSAVDAEHALIIAHDVVLDAADNRSLEPMADAAKAVLGKEDFCVVADAGYSNGEQDSNCEAKGILPCVPAKRTKNPHGNGTFLQYDAFLYQPETDTYLCARERKH